MTLADRTVAFQQTFPAAPASWPHVVREDGRDVLYATWLIGNNYRNTTRYYGAYPPGYLKRVMALFPDCADGNVLHVFSGSLPPGPYVRLDINPANQPDVVGSVYYASRWLRRRFPLVCADPPYSLSDAERYGTASVDKRRALAAIAEVTEPAGYLAWLDTCWPMHSKTQWLTVGRIFIQRSTNHRVRLLTLFERVH